MKTFSQINLMAVFGVKHREGLLPKNHLPHIHSVLAKILNEHGKGCKSITVGGTADHVHIFFSLSVRIAIEDLMREVKSRSSRWINENNLVGCHFEWQRGYGVFSYSQSARDSVIHYIDIQEEHHRVQTFREEFIEMLEKFELVSDPRDLPPNLL